MKGLSEKNSVLPRRSDFLTLLKLGAPVMVTQLGIIIVSFADTMMVGAYGLNELAASAFVNSVFLVPMVMLIGFAGGVTPLVGALFSRNDEHGVGRVLRGSVIVNFALGVAMTLIMCGLWFFLDKMGQPEELLPLIRNYYLVVLGSMIWVSLFNCCQQTSNGVTDTATPMWVMIGVNLLNIIGNYILIFGHFGAPELGLEGAGISTLVSRAAGAVAMLLIWGKSKRYRCYRAGWKDSSPFRGLLTKIWKTSYPLMLQSGVECLLWSLGAVVCGWFGKVQIAAYQVVNIIGQLGFMIYMSFGVSVSIRVANYSGLSDLQGIRRTASAGIVMNCVLATLASLVFMVAGRQLIGMFTDSAEVVASGMTLIWPLILYQYCDAVQLTLVNAQRGTSYVSPLLWASIISYILIGFPAMFLLAKTLDLGNLGVYYSFCIALAAMAVALMIWFKSTLIKLSKGVYAFVRS